MNNAQSYIAYSSASQEDVAMVDCILDLNRKVELCKVRIVPEHDFLVSKHWLYEASDSPFKIRCFILF